MIPPQNKSKSKVGLFFREDQSKWVSCQGINANLLEAYRLNHSVDLFHIYSQKINSFDLVTEIIEQQISVLVFVDHQIRPLEILYSKRLRDYIAQNNVKVIIHLYGCFMDRLMEYYEIGELLKNMDVHFIAASPRHRHLIQKTMLDPGNVHYVPFPIDTTLFTFSEKDREKYRKSLNLDEETSLFIYSGRISTFKNVELAMKLISRAVAAGKKLKFLYIGDFDNFASYRSFNYIGKNAHTNAQLLKSLDPDGKWCIHQNFVAPDELKNYLCAADAFISLSTFSRDDFGASVAEAKSCGLPAFLTDWAGLSGFKHLPENYYSKVNVTSDDLFLDLDYLEKKIMEFNPLSSTSRLQVTSCLQQHFGTKFVADELLKITTSAPGKMSGVNHRHVLRQQLASKNSFNALFELKDLYESYWC